MLKLFFTFFKIGLFTFGGGYAMIPLISEEVSEFGINQYQLSNFIAISESTPGPFAINIATFIGYSSYGILGAILTTMAVILPSFLIILSIAIFINKLKDTKLFKTFIKVSTPIILGLILSSTIKIATLNLFNIESFTLIKEQFNINIITLISFVILSIIFIAYLIIKKRRLSPFKIISLSFVCGFIGYLFTLI